MHIKIFSTLFFFSVLAGAAKAQQADTVLTDAQKIYGLSKFWQEANYNYAYFENVPGLNWDSAYQAFIPQVVATKSMYEYYRVLQKFCALLKDGHTNVYFPGYISSKRARRSFGDIKLELKNIAGKPIVVNTATLTKDIVPIGSEILQVNNTPVNDYINTAVRPYISQSASYIADDWSVDFILDGFIGDTIRIGYRKPDRTVHSMLLKREVKQEVTWLKPYNDQLFKLSWLPGNIAKVDLNSFNDRKIVDTFITVLPQLQKAKGIIIDLRENGGGNSGHAAAILSYFTDVDTLKGSRWFTREHRAAYKAWGAFAVAENDTSIWSKKERDYYYGRVWYEGGLMSTTNSAPKEKRMTTVPLAVLFGHGTASAAEDFLIVLDGLGKRAITVGQRSFASTGQPYFFDLPGGAEARVCTKKDTYPDGRVFVGRGIQPSVEVNPTYEDYMANKDVTLDKAVQLLKQQAK